MKNKLKITLIASGIDRVKSQKATLKAMGFKRLHQTVEHPDNPAIRGMVFKVKHLVAVEEIRGE